MVAFDGLFREIEASVFDASSLSESDLRIALKRYKTIDRIQERLTEHRNRYVPEYSLSRQITTTQLNNYYYWLTTYVIFYAGFNADTVTKKLPHIYKHFSDYLEVSTRNRDAVLSDAARDPDVIHNKNKLIACCENAKILGHIAEQHGGDFGDFIDSLLFDTLDNKMRSIRSLRCFDRFASVTACHFLTEIGKPVIKPDRVIRRLFKRLGLLDSDSAHNSNIRKSIEIGDRFVNATGEPHRYVDIIMVMHGQERNEELGISRGMCLDDPDCFRCRARNMCRYKPNSSRTC